MASNNQQIELCDGRLRGYPEFVDPDGKPILYFHGAHSSRLSGKVLAPVATRLNARVIAVDRPGFGLTDFKSGRQILDCPDDVTELADALRINGFAVLGSHRVGHKQRRVLSGFTSVSLQLVSLAASLLIISLLLTTASIASFACSTF